MIVGRPLAIALGLAALGALLGPAGALAAQPPNVVVVMSDDQTPDSIPRMPWLSTRDRWLRFDRFYDNQALCCPARATFLSGQYSHHHGVTSNHNARGFDDGQSLGRWLHRAGYRTGLFGKYLNARGSLRVR